MDNRTAWLTACAAQGCVEVAWDGSNVVVRDSENRDGPQLEFTAKVWEDFVNGMQEFTVPALQARASGLPTRGIVTPHGVRTDDTGIGLPEGPGQ